MDKFFVDKGGSVDEFSPDAEQRQHVRFPVYVSIRYGDELPVQYSNFVLNLSQGGLFIQTNSPLDVGLRVTMHFYIPPEEKLLAEFMGEVVWSDSHGAPERCGMGIKFVGGDTRAMDRLEDYLEERKHLIDKSV